MYRVLIVEDEKVIRQGIIYVVDWTALDCVVAGEAENGQQGLEMIERFSPDIVITDVRMPLMDGLEMIRRGRENRNFEAILLSAYDDFDYVRRALKLEACEYLLKPVNNEELMQAIENACRKTERKNKLRQMENAWKEIGMKNDGGPPEGPEMVENAGTLAEGKQEKLSFYPAKMVRYVQQHYRERISLQNLSETYEVSAAWLSREFKKEMGCSFNDFLNRYRIHRAIRIMSEKKVRVYELAQLCGFSDYKYFVSIFHKYMDCTPTEFMESQRQARIEKDDKETGRNKG